MADSKGENANRVVVGVDVGGTNTDAVVLLVDKSEPEDSIVATAKTETTRDITTGVKRAILEVLKNACDKTGSLSVLQVNIGTTHFINALIQKKDLARVSVLRLCGPASTALPPFVDIPEDVCAVIKGSFHLVGGGYQYDGRPITSIQPEEIIEKVKQIIGLNVQNIVVSGIFSPVRTDQEEEAYRIIKEVNGSLSVTLSSDIGGLGLLERENAAILNECLKPLCLKTITGFREALKLIGLQCPVFLSQNDGTVLSEADALKFPVHTISCGPTNSMRGAAYLVRQKNCIVVDIGGTSTDVGVLINGFPREAASHVSLGGVRTNFIMPDVFSFGLGGGSYVVRIDSAFGELIDVEVGPQSAGYLIKNESLVFSTKYDDVDQNRVTTALDMAVAYGLVQIGNKRAVEHLEREYVDKAVSKIQEMVEDVIDQVKASKEDVPLILVGGGSILINSNGSVNGVSEVTIPKYFEVANAIGAALCYTSGYVDEVVDITDYLNDVQMKMQIDGKDREVIGEIERNVFVRARFEARKVKSQKAIDYAVKNGAIPGTVEIIEYQDIALTYLPGNATRMKIKAVGDMQYGLGNSCTIDSRQITAILDATRNETETKKEKQITTTAGKALSPSVYTRKPVDYKHAINYTTGEWTLQEYDLQCISVGAGILGCGGGGDSHIGYLLAQKALRDGKEMKILSCDRLKRTKNGFVVDVNYMGAPVISHEKLIAIGETQTALSTLHDLYTRGHFRKGVVTGDISNLVKKDRDVTYIENLPKYNHVSYSTETLPIIALMSSEVGGANAMVPLYVAAYLNLPVVDCDGMGRAFPEVQMYTPFIYGHDFTPAVIADEHGNTISALKADPAEAIEPFLRTECVKMGCLAAMADCPISSENMAKYTIPYSLSRAWRLGDAVIEAKASNASLTRAILEKENGKILISGKIMEVNRQVSGGFTKGVVIIQGTNEYNGLSLLIYIQNENLVAKSKGKTSNDDWRVEACTPDLICIIELNTGESVPTERVRYGLRVIVLALACPELIATQKALEFVGPSAFNYSDIKYIPVAKYVNPDPIPP